MYTHQLVLRAVRTLREQRSAVSLRTLLAVVPLDAVTVARAVRTLDAQGYLDAATLRLTLTGFAASHAPVAVAHERRRARRPRGADRVERVA